MEENLQNIGTKIVQGLRWSYLGYAATFVTHIVGFILLARILDPESFGIYAVAVLVSQFAIQVSSAGLHLAIIQKKGDVYHLLSVAWTFQLAISILITIFFLLISPFVITRFIGVSDAVYPALICLSACVLNGLNNPRNTMLFREIDLKKWFLISYPPVLIRVGTSIILALIFEDERALIFGYVLSYIVQLALSYSLNHYRPVLDWDFKSFITLYRFGGWIQGKNILMATAQNFDSFVVGSVFGATILGAYNRALALCKIMERQTSVLINQAIFPMYSAIQEDGRRINLAFYHIFNLTLLSTAPVLLLVYLFGEPITALIIGDVWLPMVEILRLLLVAVTLRIVWSSLIPLVRGMGWSHIEFSGQVVQFVTVLVFMYPAVKIFGVSGAALAIALGVLLSLPVLLFPIIKLRLINFSPLYESSLTCIVATMVAVAGAKAADYMLFQYRWGLAASLVISVSAFFICLYAGYRYFDKGPFVTIREALHRLAIRKE